MIKLTLLEEDPLYVAPESIIATYDGGMATTLFIGGEEVYSVKESPEEVARKVLEYKLAMAEYSALSVKLDGSNCDKRLRELSGLGDTVNDKT